MMRLPLWMWVAATIGWCGAAMGVSFTMARWGGASIKGKKLAVMGPFLMLPFMLLSAMLPWASARVMLSFTYGWVTPWKLLLLWVANFLLDCPAWTFSKFSHFLVAVLLPVRIKGVVKGGVGLIIEGVSTLLVELGALISFFCMYERMGGAGRHGAHCVALYLVLELPHRIASIGLGVVGGVETHPLFRKPWFSTSLTDFWGNRWDLTANALLRHAVYNPIVNLLTTRDSHVSFTSPKLLHLSLATAQQIIHASTLAAPNWSPARIDVKHFALSSTLTAPASSLVSPPSKPLPLSVRLIGVNTTFFVSGLVHELLYLSLTQAAAPTWEVTSFFIVHGLATSAEITLRRACPTFAIFKLPRPLKIVFTMCFMYATSVWLFFPQLVRAGIFMTCTKEYRTITRNFPIGLLFRQEI